MSTLSIEFFSGCLMRPVTFQVYLPDGLRFPTQGSRKNPHYGRPTKTLFLLHGYTNNSGEWLYGSSFRFLAEKYTLSLHDALPIWLSMGGFGALHTAFAFPENFGKVAAMSSALLIHEIAGMKPGQDNGVANYEYYHLCFGDLDRVEESDANPETLVLKLKSENKEIPGIYMACGTEDFLLERNRAFCEFLKKEEIPVLYEEGPGSHNMQFWDAKLEPAIKWMLGN